MKVTPEKSPSRNDSADTAAARRVVRLTRVEAIPFALMNGLTDPFMVPYALALGAGAFEAGLLSSVRNLILSLSQLGTVRLIHWVRSRRRMFLWAVGIQAVLWVPLALVDPLFGRWALAALILLYTIGSTSAALGGPVWGSLVSEQLPQARRAEFFGQREMLVGLGTATAGVLGGGVLQLLAARPLFGFALLCGTAALCRTWSWLALTRLEDRSWGEPVRSRISFPAFLRRFRHDNFVRFALCFAAFNLSVHLVVPYLTIYMLTELHYGYLTYSIVVLSGPMVGNLLLPRWGRIGDRRGNRVVLRWTMVGASVLPFLWPLHPHPSWLLVLHLIGGSLWGGINLAAVNFVYDATTRTNRARYLAYFNVLNGSAIGLGAIAGGIMLKVLPSLHGSVFVSLFIISAAFRCLMTAMFERVVREVRPIHQVGLREVVLDLVGMRLIQVLGFFSVRPRRERRAARERQSRLERSE
jgi:MFS family permease